MASSFSSVAPIAKTNKTTSKPNCFAKAIYGRDKPTTYCTIEGEINRYLGDCDRSHNDVLTYWKGKENSLPGLAKMAKMYLAIPATSTPSEGAFSKTKSIIGPQRASLAPMSMEILLCLKEWYRVFGAMLFPHKFNTADNPFQIDEGDED